MPKIVLTFKQKIASFNKEIRDTRLAVVTEYNKTRAILLKSFEKERPTKKFITLNSQENLSRIKIGKEEQSSRSKILTLFNREKPKPIPEGYFRSIHSGRLVKDTPKNRFKETIDPKDIVGSKAHIEHIIRRIDSEEDIFEKRILLRKYCVDDDSLANSLDPIWSYTKNCFIPPTWDALHPADKSLNIKKFFEAEKKSGYRADDIHAKSWGQKDESSRPPPKPFKARNTLEYVSRTPTGEGDLIPSPSSQEWDSYMRQENSKGIILHPYQEKAIQQIKDQHGIIVSFDTGTGKTITSVVASLCLLHFKIVDHVFVVAPKSLLYNFEKELGYYVSPRDDKDGVLGNISCYTHNKFINVVQDLVKDPEFTDLDSSLLIVDEASEFRTAINHASGKSAHTMINSCIRAKRVICLSATPLYNDFSDVINLIAMAKGEPPSMVPPTLERKRELVRGTSYEASSSRGLSLGSSGPQIGGSLFTFHNLEEDGIPSKQVSNETSPPLVPKKREHIHDFEMSEEYYKEYLKIQRSQSGQTADPFTFLSGLRIGTNSIKPNPKIEWALDRVRDLKLKTILYSSFVDSGIKLLQDGLDARDVRYVTISGEISLKERQKAVEQYNDPESEYNVMIISKAGSLGLDLKRTREIIFIEGNWNPAQEEQVIGRACRLGSHTGLSKEEYFVDIHRLYLCKPGLDKLAEGDNVPSADSILKGILERKKKELDIYYYLLRATDIDPDKSKKYEKVYQEKVELERSEREAEARARAERSEARGSRHESRSGPQSGSRSYERGNSPLHWQPYTVETPRSILGVPETATIDECRRAFRKHAIDLHPDRNYNDTAEERDRKIALFKKMTNAMDKIDPK